MPPPQFTIGLQQMMVFGHVEMADTPIHNYINGEWNSPWKGGNWKWCKMASIDKKNLSCCVRLKSAWYPVPFSHLWAFNYFCHSHPWSFKGKGWMVISSGVGFPGFRECSFPGFRGPHHHISIINVQTPLVPFSKPWGLALRRWTGTHTPTTQTISSMKGAGMVCSMSQ